MATIQNDRDLLLQAASPRVVPLPIDPDRIPGLPEAIAATKGVRITAPGNVFQIARSGTASPASIALTASLTNISGAVSWAVIAGAGTLAGTGNTRTIAAESMTSASVTIRASVTDGGVTYSAEHTIAKVEDGADGGNGAPGANSATAWLFTRSDSTAAPVKPTGTLTYSFASGLLTGPLGAWTQTVPLAEGRYLWVTTARAAAVTPTHDIAPAEWATPRIMAEDGDNGLAGLRGSLTLGGTVPAVQRYDARPLGLAKWSGGAPSTENATAADNAARTIVWTALGNPGNPENNGHLRIGDTVTLTNGASTVAVTGYWGGSSWLHPGTTIDGNLVVKGSVSADAINSYGLSIYTPDGQLVLDASRRLSRQDLTDLGALAALNSLAYGSTGLTGFGSLAGMNSLAYGGAGLTGFGALAGQSSVALGGAQVTGNLDNSRVNGLGALALQNSINLTNQVTGVLANSSVSGLGALALLNQVNLNVHTIGALNGMTQVTNLGTLAYTNSLAANQIGAGTLAAGVIYAGTVNVDNLVGTTISGKSLSGADLIYIGGINAAAPVAMVRVSNDEARVNIRGYFDVSRTDNLSSFTISAAGNLSFGNISTGVSANFLGSSFSIKNVSTGYSNIESSGAGGVILRHNSIRMLNAAGADLITAVSARVSINTSYVNLRNSGGFSGGINGDLVFSGGDLGINIDGTWWKFTKTLA